MTIQLCLCELGSEKMEKEDKYHGKLLACTKKFVIGILFIPFLVIFFMSLFNLVFDGVWGVSGDKVMVVLLIFFFLALGVLMEEQLIRDNYKLSELQK